MKKIVAFCISVFLFIITPVVHAESNFLYDVLKNEADTGRFAKEYTGNHHDSFTEDPSKKIYHWHVNNNNDAVAINDKDNVLFADQCWKMIRTTDTGGVKMIYNGEAVDGKCSTFHEVYGERVEQYLSASYYYGQGFVYNDITEKYDLAGLVSNSGVKVGQYTCKKYNLENTCDTIYYVDEQSSGSYYYVQKVNAKFDTPRYDSNINFTSVGYMHNKVYEFQQKNMHPSNTENMFNSASPSGKTIWLGTNAVWGSSVADKYNLDNVTSLNVYSYNYSSLVGKYTFFNSSQTYTDSRVYYVSDYDDEHVYYILLSNGETLSDINHSYTYGNNYIDNGDGTYTITNPTTFNRSNYYSYYGVLSGKYVCKNAINNTCSDLWYVESTRATDYKYDKVNDLLFKYSNSFTWDGSKYILDDNSSFTTWNIYNTENRNKLNNAHYTCLNKTGECTKLFYLYHYKNELNVYFVALTDGKSIEDAVNDMLYSDDVNANDSIIKSRVDAFYEKKLLNYSNYLEDTVFCNDRTQINSDINGWNPDGGDVFTEIKFKEYNPSSDLSCLNETDRFSTFNNKAKLKYKIGLPSSPEMNILGNAHIRNIGDSYWLGSPLYFDTIPYMSSISINGDFGYSYSGIWNSLRPVISLKPNIRYTSGNGSENNPYVVDLTNYYKINVEIVNETEDLNISIEDLTQIQPNEEVTFRVTPIRGYQVNHIKIVDEDNHEIDFSSTDNINEYSFVMPSGDVTIIPSYERVKNSVEVEDSPNTKAFVIEVEDAKAVVYEDTVRFSVTPEDGFEVDYIEITDSEGNKIEYKKTNNDYEYEFVMPDTNVTITPIYKRIEKDNIVNPETSSISFLIIVFVLSILPIFGVIVYSKIIKKV